jgi:hypothetical protein
MRALLLLLFFSVGLAQAASELSVRSLTFKGKNERSENVGEQIKMPFVETSDKAVAAKMNDRLFIGQFGVMAPKQAGKYFTAADGIAIEGMASQDYSISRNDGRVLTIAFENEGCGAYCEDYRVYYSFDIQTGRMLVADDLFTHGGMLYLERRIYSERLSAYRKLLASLREDLKDAQKKPDANSQDSVNDLKERIELNSQCAGEGAHTDRTPRASESRPGFGYDKFELTGKEFRLTKERCSNHAMRALDDIGDFTLALPYKALKPHLSAYGRTLLLNEGSAKPKGGIYGQLLRGHLGGMAITMLINKESDNSVAGTYFYDRYRKPIAVSGRASGNELELIEGGAEGSEEKSTMRLSIAQDRLKGRWIGKKELDVSLAP